MFFYLEILQGQDIEAVIYAIKSIPANTTILSLGASELWQRSGTELHQILEAIPEHIISLSLEANELHKMPAKALSTALSAIPLHVTTLGLERNQLSLINNDDLAQIFGAIPTHVTRFNLHWNELSQVVREGRLAALFTAIPKGVTVLDLTGNKLGFWYELGINLINDFALLPPHVTSLILERNYFGTQNGASFAPILASIPPQVTELNISTNGFDHRTAAELILIFTALPKTINKLTINWDDIKNHSDEELIALGKALSHVVTIEVMFKEKPVSHRKVELLRNHMGDCILSMHNNLYDKSTALPLPLPLENITMHYIAPPEEMDSFLNNPRIDPPDEHQWHAFMLRCLEALAAISAVVFGVGIAALFVVTPISVSIGLTTVSAVSGILACGLFRAFEHTLPPELRGDDSVEEMFYFN